MAAISVATATATSATATARFFITCTLAGVNSLTDPCVFRQPLHHACSAFFDRAAIHRRLRIVFDHELRCFGGSSVHEQFHEPQGHVDAARDARGRDDAAIQVLD